MAALTIEQYLQVLDNHTFSTTTIQRAVEINGIAAGSVALNVEERKRDLAEAMMWEAAAGLVNGGGGSVKFGIQSKTEGYITASEQTRELWLRKAESLRAKWGVSGDNDTDCIYDGSVWQ